jgi:hypothetical protein
MYPKEQDGVGIMESNRLASERYSLKRWLNEPVSAPELLMALFFFNLPLIAIAPALSSGN